MVALSCHRLPARAMLSVVGGGLEGRPTAGACSGRGGSERPVPARCSSRPKESRMRSNRRRATRHVAIAGTIVLVATMTTSNASAQSAFEVVASGLNNPRHLTFSPSGDLFVVEAGSGGDGPCVLHPAVSECSASAFGRRRTQVGDRRSRQAGRRRPAVDLGPIRTTLGPSDIAFNGNKKFVISIGLRQRREFNAGFGEDGDAARDARHREVAARRVLAVRRRPGERGGRQPGARTSTATRPGCSAKGVVTSSPTPAATPSSRCTTRASRSTLTLLPPTAHRSPSPCRRPS